MQCCFPTNIQLKTESSRRINGDKNRIFDPTTRKDNVMFKAKFKRCCLTKNIFYFDTISLLFFISPFVYFSQFVFLDKDFA